MTLQTRLTVTLAVGVALVITAFQGVQFLKIQGSLERVGQANAQILKASLSGNAEDIQRALEFGISTGMAAGDMDVFGRVTKLQKELHGLQEFSLYNAKGRISDSSDPSRLRSEMDPELQQQLYSHPERLVRETTTLIDIYEPHVVNKSCLECHTDWKIGMVGGVTHFRYSKQALAEAESQSRLATRQASQGSLVLAAITIGGSLLVISVLVTLLIRPVTRHLSAVVLNLDEGTHQVNGGAAQVSATAQSLAEGASEQAASLEETSSSLEEIASMTKSNAENAQKANALAQGAHNAAEQGAADMKQMTGAMQDIKNSSDDISKIIKTIDEIAFQTNILALNAAVEAARAGEAGMGFAVVAEEVRALAQRSAQAAKETSGKIEGALSNTGRGVELSTKVNQTLEEIVSQLRQVDALISQVANASREQSEGINQINLAVAQMDKVTQSNAASAEESSAASQELCGQAGMLQDLGDSLLALISGQALPENAQERTLRPSFSTSPSARSAQGQSSPPGGNGRPARFTSAAPPSPKAGLTVNRGGPGRRSTSVAACKDF